MHAKTYISVVAIFFVMSISSALFMDRVFSQTTACNYYASPTGTGNGLSQSSPFKISNFWSLAKPGYVLCLLDGTYTGSSSMIFPPENLNGSSGAPITVRALNDGKVLINWRRQPEFQSVSITTIGLSSKGLTLAARKKMSWGSLDQVLTSFVVWQVGMPATRIE